MKFDYDLLRQNPVKQDNRYYHWDMVHHDSSSVQNMIKYRDENRKMEKRLVQYHDKLIERKVLTEDQYTYVHSIIVKGTVNAKAVLDDLAYDYNHYQAPTESKSKPVVEHKVESKRRSVSEMLDDNELPFSSSNDTKPSVSTVKRDLRRQTLRQRNLAQRESMRPTRPVRNVSQPTVRNTRKTASPLEVKKLRDTIRQKQNRDVPNRQTTMCRPTLPKNLLDLIRARWATAYNDRYTDEQAQKVSQLSDRDVIMLLILNELAKYDDDSLPMKELLKVGNAYLSQYQQNLAFDAKRAGDEQHWATVQRAIFEGLKQDQNRSDVSLSEQVDQLSRKVSDMTYQVSQVHTDEQMLQTASIITLLQSLGVLSANESKIVNIDTGRIDASRLSALSNLDSVIATKNVLQSQASRNLNARKRNGYQYRK